MLLSAVSVLVVARSSSEIPEGLMNNPVYVYAWISWLVGWFLHLCLCTTFVSEREAFDLMVLLIAKIMNEIRFIGRGIKYDYGPLMECELFGENQVLLFLPQIPHGLVCDWMWVCVVRGWLQPACSMAQPLESLAVLFKKFSGQLIKTTRTR